MQSRLGRDVDDDVRTLGRARSRTTVRVPGRDHPICTTGEETSPTADCIPATWRRRRFDRRQFVANSGSGSQSATATVAGSLATPTVEHGSRDIGAVIRDRRRVAADALVIGGGALLVASAFMHWVSSGYGSGLRGHALIDAIIAVGRHFPGMSAARLTVLWYLVPASGAASLDRGRAARRGESRDARRRGRRRGRRGASVVAIGWLVGYSNLGVGRVARARRRGRARRRLVGRRAPPRCGRPIGQNGRPGPVAQWSEQGTHNPSVEGSIPSRPTLSTSTNAIREGLEGRPAGPLVTVWSPFDHGRRRRSATNVCTESAGIRIERPMCTVSSSPAAMSS